MHTIESIIMAIPPLEKRHGHRGVAHLRVAVLEVLYAAYQKDECIGPADIGRRAGIFREPGYASKEGNDHIVWGILNSLVKDKLLTRCKQKNKKSGWQLTKETFDKRYAEVSACPDWGGKKRIIEASLLKQWGFCPGCLAVLSKTPYVNHVKAKSVGGEDIATNKQLLCPNCTRRRGAKPFEEFVAERLKDGNEWTDYTP